MAFQLAWRQNLFALHPLVQGAFEGRQSIFEQILDVEEALTRVDYLIMDLRPQNVFFDPKRGEITVIDIGTCVDLKTAAGPAACHPISTIVWLSCANSIWSLRARRRTPRATGTLMAWGRRWDLPGSWIA